jgi:hypothetical protein
MALPADRCDDLPLIDRPVIEWPNGACVAFWVAPDVEHYGYLPPLDGSRNPWPRTPVSGKPAVPESPTTTAASLDDIAESGVALCARCRCIPAFIRSIRASG